MGKQETKPDKKPMRMVTSKMSIEETIEVLREDLKTNVRSKAWRKHILLNPKVEGMARFPSGVDSVLINTPVMEWGVRFYVLSKQEWKQQTIDRCGQFYCLVPSNAGFHVYLFVTMDTGENAVFVFPPHFFIRYRERYWGKHSTLSGKILRKTYLKDNLVMRYGLQPGSEERVAGARIYGASSHGVALGIVLNDEAYLFKTFITYAMTKGEQIPLYMQEKLSMERAQVEYYNTGRLADLVELEERDRKRREMLMAEERRREEEEKRRAAEPGEAYFYVEGPLTLIMPDEEMQEENTGFWQRGTTMFCDSKLIEESQREMRELASVEARIQELKNIPQKAEEKKGVFKRLFGRYF